MDIDLKALGEFLCETGLMEKKITDMDRSEIMFFCEQVHCATVEQSGWCPPYLNEREELVIPADAPPKYRYWMKGGQSIRKTLEEMNVPNEIIERYTPKKDREGIPNGK